MSTVGQIARDWLPPVFIRWLAKVKGSAIRFDGEYATWEDARAKCAGYDNEEILARVLSATLKVKRGEAAFERDSVLFDKNEYVWPVLAGLMWAAARGKGSLNVLDFGGSLGSSYFQHQNFLSKIPKCSWNVVEQAHYVAAGRARIQNEQLRFYETIDKCLVENEPNVILLSSVLQYVQDPRDILLSLLDIGAEALIIDRTIVNRSSSDRIYIQYVSEDIYPQSYPCRSLSELKLYDLINEHYILMDEFCSLEFPALFHIDSEFKGYLFRKIRQKGALPGAFA